MSELTELQDALNSAAQTIQALTDRLNVTETTMREQTTTKVCAYLRNWFERKRYKGKFEIERGKFPAEGFLTDEFSQPLIFPDEIRILITDFGEFPKDALKNGQYFRIVGSILNDGVYQFPTVGLADEVFEGEIWSMAIPPVVLQIIGNIRNWETKYADLASSPYTNESFGGYSYSKPGLGSGSGPVSWESIFRDQLAPWRKL